MKPDWNDAPEWAEWLAMDADGQYWWFEKEPKFEDEEWNTNQYEYRGEMERVRTLEPHLEQRPS